MNYIEYLFKVEPLQPGTEILIAELGFAGFESFVETEEGVMAYIQKNEWSPGILDDIAILKSDEFKIDFSRSEIEQINLQLNRRVEFNIVGATNPYVAPAKTYILKQKVTVDQLAKITGTTADEIKLLNGLKGNLLPAFTPVRLKSEKVLNIPGYLFSLPKGNKSLL